MKIDTRHFRQSALTVAILMAVSGAVVAQDTQATKLNRVEVTGSRIKKTEVVGQAPVFTIDRKALERTGLGTVGDILQQLTSGGKALNARFNSSGNFGYPPDGGGIGAGSSQVDLRHLGSQRVLVLVDGIRWVNESSASGVGGSADLNTIPLSIIDRIEVLEDGASAIYGSDAIAGVINIITRKDFDGAEVSTSYGEWSRGGETTEAGIAIGGAGDRFNGFFSANYYDQEGISSGSWGQSAFPIPGGGLAYGSSGTPQGRFVFCDPAITVATQTGFCGNATNPVRFFSVTLNNGVSSPVWNRNNITAGTYHPFTGADRFNYSPFNLLLTPSERKSVFTSVNYDITDNTQLHIKALYNNRQSMNQAAPEPIFVGPGAGTGGIADTISIAANQPFNPFGIRLDAASNFLFIGRRPLEVGPRVFIQDVDTWYVNIGLDGIFNFGDRGMDWNVNYVHSENSAEQVFTNGYNIAKLKLGLGDPAICAAVAGCTPIDLFGGQSRPMTQEMINWIRTTQNDSSKQVLDLISANLTGDLFNIGDQTAGFALGVEFRDYEGDFNPDPLRQTGESQDSFARAISANYDVTELYGEINVPFASMFEVSAALRHSDYSTFGNATTGKIGAIFRPSDQFLLRGTYSEGFRAPNLGELFGLTQFGATLTDPCGPTNGPLVVDNSNGLNNTPLETACRLQGVPSGYRQANTQITTFTGGNADLQPEESESYTFGAIYAPSWAEGLSWSERMDFEVSYYDHTINGAVQARDIQALLDACLAAGGSAAVLCSPFTRIGSGDLRPPNNFLDNLGVIETDGLDVKANWQSPDFSFGSLSASLQATKVFDYKAVDSDGNQSRRGVGVEVDDSAIPDWQSNLQLGWTKGDINASWNVRYIDSVMEACNGDIEGLPGCPTADAQHKLGSTVYNDFQFGWNNLGTEGLRVSVGVNNAFDKDAPICLTCSLNGYDAGTYDLPGRYWYARLAYKF